ncbi:KorA family transcriptional regulator [Halomonas sp. 3A7M]|uniref:KorA family transcriptional regulator n=1 Tax=Halomonas sp. 3A7M TaxID=2742616 RepID=UPI001865EA6F|nr:KorA family transcriptional regulator [Halomonas sp. 3A7M]
MKKIQQHSVDVAFENREAADIEVIRRSDRQWYFTFKAAEPLSRKLEEYTLSTQQGELRTWADPRRLFRFLSERGVRQGTFVLHDEDVSHASGDGVEATE